MKALSLVAATATFALAGAVFAEDAKKIDPAKSGPTEAVTDSVPDMKAPADGSSDKSTNSDARRPATKNVGDAVPPMKPTDPAQAGTSTTTTPSTTTGATETPADKSKAVQ